MWRYDGDGNLNQKSRKYFDNGIEYEKVEIYDNGQLSNIYIYDEERNTKLLYIDLQKITSRDTESTKTEVASVD